MAEGINEMEVKYLEKRVSCNGNMEENNVFELERNDEDCASVLCTEQQPEYIFPAKIKQLDNDLSLLKLKEQADVQCKLMRQASKALEVYRSHKQNSFDVEMEVEAEKILLAATCKHEQIMQQLGHRHDYEEPAAHNYTASVLLKNIHIRLCDRVGTTYFVLVLCRENDVRCSEALFVPTKHCVAAFNDIFVFENFTSNFRLKLEVFAFTPETEDHSNKHLIKSKQRKKYYKNLNTDSFEERNVRAPSFITQGHVILSAIDFAEHYKSMDMMIVENSILSGKAQIDLRISDLKVETAKRGFITVGEPDNFGIVWNRRWCVLEETIFKHYNYPNETDEGDPIRVLDLKLIGSEVAKAKRCECAKPKTLHIQLIGLNDIFLNFDTISDMHDWKNMLNMIYNFLNDWKMLLRT